LELLSASASLVGEAKEVNGVMYSPKQVSLLGIDLLAIWGHRDAKVGDSGYSDGRTSIHV
jgi:hypothetical protein